MLCLFISNNIYAARYSSANVAQLNIAQTINPGTVSHPIVRLNILGTGASTTQTWSVNSVNVQLTNPSIYDKVSILYAINSTTISNASFISSIDNPGALVQFQNLNSFATFSGATSGTISFFIVVDVKSNIVCDSSIIDALIPINGINIFGGGGGLKTPSPNDPIGSGAVATSVTPTISITSNATSICRGQQINFSSLTSNAGNSPSYTWILNNDSVSNLSNYSSSNFNNGDSIKCILTSSNVCAVPKNITSNTTYITILEPPLSSLNLIGKQSVCSPNNSFTLKATANQNPISYQWKKDNVVIPGAIIDSLVTTVSGNYNIKITNTITGCFSESALTTVAFGANPSVSASTTSNLYCPSTSINLIALNTTNYNRSFSNSSTLSIPDFNINGVNSTISVNGLPIEMSNVKIAVTINATHNWNSDLEFYLMRPNGNLSTGYGATLYNTIAGESIVLAADVGDGGKNFSNLTLTDSAQLSINALSGVNMSNISGNYKPISPLSSLSGNPNGTWTLKVCDDESVDIGSLTGWSIKFTINDSTTYTWTSTPSGFQSSNKNPTVPTITSITNFNLVAIDNHSGCSKSSSVTIYIDSIKPIINCNSALVFLNNFGIATLSLASINNGSYDNCELALSTSKSVFDTSNIGLNQVYLRGMDATGNMDSCLAAVNVVNNFTMCVLNIKLFLQGFYINNQLMRASLYNNGLSLDPSDVDSIEVILHYPNAPFNAITSKKAILKSNGELLIQFPLSFIGTNCIVGIKHRSSIKTYYKYPVVLKQFNTFNFTN